MNAAQTRRSNGKTEMRYGHFTTWKGGTTMVECANRRAMLATVAIGVPACPWEDCAYCP